MTVSLPSKEATVVDVPEVKQFKSEFVYNFHVPDELINEDASNIPRSILQRPAESFDSDDIDKVRSRIPRFIRFDFLPIHLQNPTMVSDDADQRKNSANRKIGNEGLLRRFYEKIIGEQEFASDSFKVVTFSDQGIDKKLHEFVSGSLATVLEDVVTSVTTGKTVTNFKVEDFRKEIRVKRGKDPLENQTLTDQVKQFNARTPSTIGYDFIARAMNVPKESNIYFIDANGHKGEGSSLEGLKNVSIRCQISSKVFDTIVKSAYFNPTHTISGELTKLASISETHQKEARSKSFQVSQADYMTIVDPYDVCSAPSINVTTAQARIIGYVIDKWKLLPNSDLVSMEPILLENQHINTAIDYKVQYGATYAYQIRTVAEFVIPAITQEDNQLVSIKLLISSRPTRKVFVTCVESKPPPFPTDLDFVWDYEHNDLIVSWTFPPNSQRDVKKFQVFRRRTIKEPFQLLKMYDFDDTIRPDLSANVDPEHVPQEFVEHMTNPKLTYVDHDFKKDSKYIYAVCAIDAHGFSSNYSTQMEVSFDRFANRLVRKLICVSNCPKPYPNMNLARETFVESMFHEGGTRMKLYFVPEHLEIYNDRGHQIPVLSTNKKGASYRMSIINLDVQKQASVDIDIDDRRKFEKALAERFKRGLKSVSPDRFTP